MKMKYADIIKNQGNVRRRDYVDEQETHRDQLSFIYNSMEGFVRNSEPTNPYEPLRSKLAGRAIGDLKYLNKRVVHSLKEPYIENLFKLATATLKKLGYLDSSHVAARLTYEALENIKTRRGGKLGNICESFAIQLTNSSDITLNFNETMR